MTEREQEPAASSATVVFDDPDVLADRATMQAAFEAEQQEDADRKHLAQEVRTALDLLDNGATLAQTRAILARLIRYLVRAGYDPMGMASLLDALDAETKLQARLSGQKSETPDWLSSHPRAGIKELPIHEVGI